MFKFGLSGKIRSSSLAWACDKPKNNVWNSSIHPSLSTNLAIVHNIIFTFTLDGEELEKYLFVTIMNRKMLTCFITLH